MTRVQMLDAARVLGVSEKAFSQMVVALARLMGWKVYHTWVSIHSAGGFPDLTMVRGKRLIFAELKAGAKALAPAQAEWAEALKGTGAEVYTWRPSDWDELVRILERELS